MHTNPTAWTINKWEILFCTLPTNAVSYSGISFLVPTIYGSNPLWYLTCEKGPQYPKLHIIFTFNARTIRFRKAHDTHSWKVHNVHFKLAWQVPSYGVGMPGPRSLLWGWYVQEVCMSRKWVCGGWVYGDGYIYSPPSGRHTPSANN